MTDINAIIQVAHDSNLYRYKFKQRGVAPAGYIKGMAVAWSDVLLSFRHSDPAMLEAAKVNSGNDHRDAISWLNSIFLKNGMRNDVAGEDTLRHLFVLLIGLGMRETSGTYCDGRDMSAHNVTADTAEAGLFQMSWDIRAGSHLIVDLFTLYSGDGLDSAAYTDIFKEGVHCTATQWQNYGSGDGKKFQSLCKDYPLFAVKVALVGLRNIRTHWGPINRREVEILAIADQMLKDVTKLIV